MKKKIFVNKNSRSGFRTSLKVLFWAAIGLVILVLFIPLTSRQKAGKEVPKKPPVEKGKVVKEIPRSLQPVAESISRGQGESRDAPKEPDAKPAAPVDGRSAGLATSTPQPPAAREKGAETPPPVPKTQAVAEGVAKPPAGRPPTPEPGAGQVVKETQPPPPVADAAAKEGQLSAPRKPEPAAPPTPETKLKAMAPTQPPTKPAKPTTEAGAAPAPAAGGADSPKPAAQGGHPRYAVQVAVLKDKQAAEDLRKSLQKKGFDVVVKTTGDPKQGQSFTLQLQPVENMSKASTLMEQVKYIPQVKPSIITVGRE